MRPKTIFRMQKTEHPAQSGTLRFFGTDLSGKKVGGLRMTVEPFSDEHNAEAVRRTVSALVLGPQ